MFEELSVEPDTDGVSKRSPRPKPTKLAQVSYVDEETELVNEDHNDEDEMLIDDEDDSFDMQLEEPSYSGGRAHYKGKGRAWKKTSEDEDQDYVSPVKIKGTNQPKRKLGRRKSTNISDDLVREVDELEEVEAPKVKEVVKEVKKEPVVRNTTPKAEKPKRKPRKSQVHLSEEFVKDDSDTEAGDQQDQPPTLVSPVHKTPKPKGRPRKSDQGASSKSTVMVNDDADSDALTPTQKKSTPKSQPRKTRGSIISMNNTPEGHRVSKNDEIEQDVTLLSPLRKPRKRKSGGSDDSHD
jgi:hypothetical protein